MSSSRRPDLIFSVSVAPLVVSSVVSCRMSVNKRTTALCRSALTGVLLFSSGLVHAQALSSSPQGPSSVPDEQVDTISTLGVIQVKGQGWRLPAAYPGGQISKGGGVGVLGVLDVLNTPFSTVNYTEEFIRDQQATDVGSVVGATDPSVYVAQKRGVQESFLIRGFSVGGLNDIYFNGLAGMAPVMRGSTEMLERIEVQKGPSAMLRGAAPDGSVGGSINLVSKRAGEIPLARLTTTYESDSLFGVHADLGRRFGEQQQFGIRVNGVLRDGDTAVNEQRHKMNLGSVALDWRGERARLFADVYRQRETLKGANYFGISTIADAVTELPDPFRGDTNLAPPWSFNVNTTTAAMARAELDVTDNTVAYVAYGRREGSYDALITGTSLLNNAGDLNTSVTRQYYHQVAHSGELGLTSIVATGPLTHHLSLSTSRYRAEYGATFARAFVPLGNIYDMDYGPEPVFPGFSTAKPPMMLRTELNSVAVADRMTWLDDKVQLSLGLRHQTMKSTPLTDYARAMASPYDKSAVSPTIALLVKPTERLSLYGNYIQGLTEGGTAPMTAANPLEVLPPLKTKQYEMGLKYNWGDVVMTASVFQITKPSAVTDPVTRIYAASGEQRNRGLELNVMGEPGAGLRLMGGMAYTQASLRKQLDPRYEGKQAVGVPKWVTRMGVEYDLASIPGLSLNGQVNYVGKRFVTADERLSTNAYATVDVGARYNTRLAGKPLVLRANVMNVTNKAYWAGSLGSGLGLPRTFMLSVSLDF